MTKEEIKMVQLVRESDVIDKTDDSELARAFNYLFDNYVEKALERGPCEDAVSREEVIKCFDSNIAITDKDNAENVKSYLDIVIEYIENLPTVQHIKPKGEWIEEKDEMLPDWHCSRCGAIVENFEQGYHNWRYCYHCGTEMRKSGGDNAR